MEYSGLNSKIHVKVSFFPCARNMLPPFLYLFLFQSKLPVCIMPVLCRESSRVLNLAQKVCQAFVGVLVQAENCVFHLWKCHDAIPTFEKHY